MSHTALRCHRAEYIANKVIDIQSWRDVDVLEELFIAGVAQSLNAVPRLARGCSPVRSIPDVKEVAPQCLR